MEQNTSLDLQLTEVVANALRENGLIDENEMVNLSFNANKALLADDYWGSCLVAQYDENGNKKIIYDIILPDEMAIAIFEGEENWNYGPVGIFWYENSDRYHIYIKK